VKIWITTTIACAVLSCVARADPPAAPTSAVATAAEKPGPSAVSPVATETPSAEDAQTAHLKQLEKQLRARGYSPRMMRGDVFFCRREIPLGSRLASVDNCVSVAGAERIANGSREDLESMQRQGPHCLTGGVGKNVLCGN
jgi:hypothetical protein